MHLRHLLRPPRAPARRSTLAPRFLVPSDLPCDSQTAHGNLLRIEGTGSLARDVGIWLPDGTHHGLFSLGDEGAAALCALLVQ